MLRTLATLFLSVAIVCLAGCSDEDCPTCTEGPLLMLNKHKIDFGAASTTATFTIDNIGGGSMPWDATVSYRFLAKSAAPNHGGWLELSVEAGEGDATITATVDREGLDEIGVSRAIITINAPDAENMIRDSIDVYVLNGGEWLVTDDESYEDCWEVDSLDYYWVKGFHLPHGQSRIFVDSVAINFCQGDTIIQILAYEAALYEVPQGEGTVEVYFPDFLTYASEFAYEVVPGWNVFPVDLYFSSEPYYVGYYQPGSSRPDLQIDRSNESDTLCFRARDVSTEPGTVELQWQWQPGFESFAIRAFITPVLEYHPKLAREYLNHQAEATLRTGFAHKGTNPMSVRPLPPR